MAHTNYQSLLNGNMTQLSVARLGDAKSIPAVGAPPPPLAEPPAGARRRLQRAGPCQYHSAP